MESKNERNTAETVTAIDRQTRAIDRQTVAVERMAVAIENGEHIDMGELTINQSPSDRPMQQNPFIQRVQFARTLAARGGG